MKKEKIEKLEDLAKILLAAKRVTLLAHISPDVDGVGSMLALARALEGKGVEVKRFLADPIPSGLFFLEDVDKISTEFDINDDDLVVALDCGDMNRTGVAQDLAKRAVPLVVIDHHPQADPFGDYNFVDASKTSTAEIVYKLLTIIGAKINKPIADMLLAGIVCDTQSFQISSTSADVLQIASDLMRRGARMPIISKDLFRVKPLTALKLWGRVLDRVQVDPDTEMAFSVVEKSDFEDLGVTAKDLEGLIDVINSVSEAKFSLLLSQDGDNIVKGSLRSEEFKKVDVSKIAEVFGGGGHKLASGFRMNGRLEKRSGRWIISK